LKERCIIENTYAKSLRKLCKNYEQINQKKFIYKDQMITNEELNKLTFINTFVTKLNEIKDVAGQHELIAENLQKRIIEKVNTHIKTFKDERKKCIDERDKHFVVYQNSDDLLRKSKLKYESAFKDAEKSKEILNRVEQDDNSSRMDIRKQQTIYEQKLRTCDSLKADYANHLCEANKVKGKYYNEQLPSVLNNLQMLEEKRINSYKEYLIDSISIETEVMPRIEKCYKEMMNASNRISPANDVDVVVQLFKTGYKIPTDHIFEDLGEPTSCNSSVNNNNNESSTPSNSVTSIGFNGSKSRDKKYGTLNPLKKIGIFSKTKTEIESLYDLAPQQQKKELQKKIDQLKIDINKEEKER
jgi:formin-binding protein 1